MNRTRDLLENHSLTVTIIASYLYRTPLTAYDVILGALPF